MFEKIRFQNGLTVILTKISQVRSLSIGVWVGSGVAYESGYPNGIAHFAEHMLFKGTHKRTAKEIAKEIEDIGGEINAFTSREFTCYYTRSLDDYLDKCLDILSDIYLDPLISEDEIEKEKNVIKQEISMYEDSPDELIHDLIIHTMWSGNTYGDPISGTKESVSSISRISLAGFVRDFYTPGNTVISIAGSFDRGKVLELIDKYFVFKYQGKSKEINTDHVYTPNIYHRDKDTEQNHICIGFQSYDIFDIRNYDIACFNSLFGNGMSSVLFQRIREELGLVYSVYSYNLTFTKGGAFIIYAGLDRSNTKLYFSEIDKLISTFTSSRITKEELAVVKNKLKSNYILSLESPSSLMNYTGSSEIVKRKIDTPEEISAKIGDISLDSLYSSITGMFCGRRSVVLLGKYEGKLIEFS